MLLPSTPHRQHAVDAVLSFLDSNDAGSAAAARSFVARMLGLTTLEMSLENTRALAATEVNILEPLLLRLRSGEPLAYVEGSIGFYKHVFAIDKRALIPRADSETVVELCLDHLGERSRPRLLDIGTGSGCLLISLLKELPTAHGVAVDVEQDALNLTSLNAKILEVDSRLSVLLSDCLSALSSDQQFDLIVSNPPYITHGEQLGPSVAEFEPHSALFVTDGDPMQFYRKIMLASKQHLTDDGLLVFEIGAQREQQLAQLAAACGYAVIEQRKDMSSIVRAIALKPKSLACLPGTELSL
ncbi:MAG: release factor glutamine methyltransferase [Myxococcota bacterium]